MADTRRERTGLKSSKDEVIGKLLFEYTVRRDQFEHLTAEEFLFQKRRMLKRGWSKELREVLQVVDVLQETMSIGARRAFFRRVGRTSRFLAALEPKLRNHFLRESKKLR